jgi:hypothetical protein
LCQHVAARGAFGPCTCRRRCISLSALSIRGLHTLSVGCLLPGQTSRYAKAMHFLAGCVSMGAACCASFRPMPMFSSLRWCNIFVASV